MTALLSHVWGLWGTAALDGDNSSSSNMTITCSPVLRSWYLYMFWRFYKAVVSPHWFEPQWMALNQSQGIKKPVSKLFMCLTIVELEILVYIPALIMFVWVWQGSWSKWSQVGHKATMLLERKLIHSPLWTARLTLYYLNNDNPSDNLSFNTKWVSQISTFSYNVWLYFGDVSTKDIHCANVTSDSKDDPVINTKEATSFDTQVMLNHTSQISASYDHWHTLGIWPRCMPAFAATLLRVKQEFRAWTLLCAAGSMDAEHPGYVNCNI